LTGLEEDYRSRSFAFVASLFRDTLHRGLDLISTTLQPADHFTASTPQTFKQKIHIRQNG
jgi:hypothetical protein